MATDGAATVSSDYRLFQSPNPVLALGLAVSHMMNKPAFAQRRFGDWSRILVGQINRRHYQFVVDPQDKVVGFLGWALTSTAVAEAWVENRGSFSDAEAKEGECIIFNAWSADAPGVGQMLLDAARVAMHGRKTIYFKRFYPDGSVRPVRLAVNDAVIKHLARAMKN